jgi:hypothetical protein
MGLQDNDKKNQSNYEMEARSSAKHTMVDGKPDSNFLKNRAEGSIFPMKDDKTGLVNLYVKFDGKIHNAITGVAID